MNKVYIKILLFTLVLFVFNSNKSMAQEVHQLQVESNSSEVQKIAKEKQNRFQESKQKHQQNANNSSQNSCQCGITSLDSFIGFQSILLRPGWNLISFDVSPANKTIQSVFGGLQAGNLEFITSFDNETKTYDPDLQWFLNTLLEIEDGFGYWVKVNSCDLLNISGSPIDENFMKPLDTGWNLVAYPPDSPQPPATYFSNFISNNNEAAIISLKFVTGFECETGTKTYNPNGPPFLNTLEEMKNGFGYWIKVVNKNPIDPKLKANNVTNVFSFINGTSNLPVGEQVKVLNEAGETIATLEVVQDSYLNTATIYGDDVTTKAIENISIGENLRFSWNNQILDFTTTFKGDYEIEKVNLQFKLENLINSLAVKVYPIPAKDVLSFEITVEEATDLLLQIFDAKGRLVQSINNTSLSVGNQVITSNIENLAQGIYTYKLNTGNQLSAGKFNVVR